MKKIVFDSINYGDNREKEVADYVHNLFNNGFIWTESNFIILYKSAFKRHFYEINKVELDPIFKTYFSSFEIFDISEFITANNTPKEKFKFRFCFNLIPENEKMMTVASVNPKGFSVLFSIQEIKEYPDQTIVIMDTVNRAKSQGIQIDYKFLSEEFHYNAFYDICQLKKLGIGDEETENLIIQKYMQTFEKLFPDFPENGKAFATMSIQKDIMEQKSMQHAQFYFINTYGNQISSNVPLGPRFI